MKAKYLVADSAAFIKHCDLKEMSEQVYTCQDVVAEIRDSATRQRLQVLPYELKFKSPAPKYIKKVVEVAKTTGDYASLSVTDIKVVALTYQLQCEFDSDPMADISELVKDHVQLGGGSVKDDLKIPGFYMPKDDEKKEGDDVEKLASDLESASINAEDDDDDDDDWITPAKLREMEELSLKEKEDEKEQTVACLTTDFSMQNVMFKMKLNVISVDGLLIKNIRSYLLRCFSCTKTTTIMTKKFCPSCGNSTMKRVPIQVQDDGSIKMFFSRNPKVMSKKGKKFSLPMPKGGKHGVNPILCEDQRIPQNYAPKKSRQKTNVWDEDYDSNISPFASNDVHSQAFRLGVNHNQRGRRNPNQVGQKFVKRR